MHKKWLIILYCMALTLVCFKAKATHIVGGELNYKYLGANDYEIRLTVYRDCYVGVPPFDNPAKVGIFSSTNQLLRTIDMTFRGLDTLPSSINDPCTIPPLDFCYEVTTYVEVVNLPPRTGGYQLSYQRCCRNQNIINIINPGCVGATYYASIPGPEIAAINSNPVINYWPPPFICADKPWVFNGSATDADGDSLVYELFTPFDGLNAQCPIIANIQLQATACPNNIFTSCPNLPISPPFSSIVWKAPYNQANMLGGIPMKINSSTGLITATPNLQGYFVIGIKVKEYRHGVFLGETKRDFQLIVKSCPSMVVAAAQAPEIICGTTSIYFSNNSTGNGGLGYNWNFGDPTTQSDTSHLATPTYTYANNGSYSVTLIAYVTNKPTCKDTVTTIVAVSNEFKSTISYTPMACSNNTVKFSSFIENPPGTTPKWNWSFGDGGTSSEQNPIHQYPSGGSFSISLITFVPNSINCQDTLSAQTIEVTPTEEFYIPNTFTPNGDGYNDLFRVRGITYSVFYFAVYNRWGELIFETKNPNEGWDGTHQGKPADPGVFGYYLKAKCDEQSDELFKKGNVTLIR